MIGLIQQWSTVEHMTRQLVQSRITEVLSDLLPVMLKTNHYIIITKTDPAAQQLGAKFTFTLQRKLIASSVTTTETNRCSQEMLCICSIRLPQARTCFPLEWK